MSNNKKCFICKEESNNLDVLCHSCNREMHKDCEEKYRGSKGYCQCPNCNDVGTLGSEKIVSIIKERSDYQMYTVVDGKHIKTSDFKAAKMYYELMSQYKNKNPAEVAKLFDCKLPDESEKEN